MDLREFSYKSLGLEDSLKRGVSDLFLLSQKSFKTVMNKSEKDIAVKSICGNKFASLEKKTDNLRNNIGNDNERRSIYNHVSNQLKMLENYCTRFDGFPNCEKNICKVGQEGTLKRLMSKKKEPIVCICSNFK